MSEVPERARPALYLPSAQPSSLTGLALVSSGASRLPLPTTLPCPPRRSVLKLVNCVQQERGITCGWVAGCGSLDYFGSRLGERRAGTDAALTKDVALTFPWVAPELEQLRGEVDRAVEHHRHLADTSFTTAADADADDADADAAGSLDSSLASSRGGDAAVPAADAAAPSVVTPPTSDDERREQLKRQLQQRPPLPSTPPAASAIESSEREPPASAPAGQGRGVRMVHHSTRQRESDVARDMCEASSNPNSGLSPGPGP